MGGLNTASDNANDVRSASALTKGARQTSRVAIELIKRLRYSAGRPGARRGISKGRRQASEPGVRRYSHVTDAGGTAGSYHQRMDMTAETIGSQSEFASFLKTRRRSIPPESATLGARERLPARRGRRVTQEEIAEAVGISRNWYRRLESFDAPRASAKLLDRIAQAFQFTPEERMKLFLLGIPEIG